MSKIVFYSKHNNNPIVFDLEDFGGFNEENYAFYVKKIILKLCNC